MIFCTVRRPAVGGLTATTMSASRRVRLKTRGSATIWISSSGLSRAIRSADLRQQEVGRPVGRTDADLARDTGGLPGHVVGGVLHACSARTAWAISRWPASVSA